MNLYEFWFFQILIELLELSYQELKVDLIELEIFAILDLFKYELKLPVNLVFLRVEMYMLFTL